MKAEEARELQRVATNSANVTKELEEVYSRIKDRAQLGHSECFINTSSLTYTHLQKIKYILQQQGYSVDFGSSMAIISWEKYND